MLNKQQILASAQRTIAIEYAAVKTLTSHLDDNFAIACEYLYNCRGRIVVTGMGKSGHIANKIAATLASTGNPAFFVHPGEANHGDIGMIVKDDVVIALSKSGNNPEILALLPALKRLKVPLITLTGNAKSLLAKAATLNLDVSIAKEACPFDLAPTASTTVALVMGDALAIALLELRKFTKEDFARSHPGGALGKRLLLKVDDIMRTTNQIPKVNDKVSLREALLEMTQKRMGFTAVVNNKSDQLLGIFTDGDLRRALEQGADIHKTIIGTIIKPGCKTISKACLAIHALELMEKNKVTALLILDANNKIVGATHMHDLLEAGLAV